MVTKTLMQSLSVACLHTRYNSASLLTKHHCQYLMYLGQYLMYCLCRTYYIYCVAINNDDHTFTKKFGNFIFFLKPPEDKKRCLSLSLVITIFLSNEQRVRITSVSIFFCFFCFTDLLFPGVRQIFLCKLIALRQSSQPQVVRPTDSEKEVLTAVSRGSPVSWMTF